ncbi:MAG: hypothetical protein A3C43_02965 [Candidatus Schekmanbacteria bacterium RIFCSPHIGHO2_02_FULL_38_11]|uniref:DUF4345 domain-containing protein n=1 Tax=Candidatus Schekmanbacteria bacterium RIFCSPLOWO2_12_FULL_38_15 TaxID=1817883 RepID=A0A1F7SEF1_9BACT|nr:MAG: hypothetical protein A2043_10405 [Candidatus Schekmanbacteria bacterium GWA2_38_9]OGL49472.1 MAG: hypothetical protein A3H37_10225 [Candidatus Schekmanbacteria bacterium RIFCSPLOWO2_02_FULL_38_14]OGL52163.1 MAG: hypothetical protein A3G31_07025 [Candidatus Schekmanbacteria bacterium RIFCSPLOWO2_12_FULL_38_15]OGL53582.1 MAG: hypothetical protein A3C43_02965 [Candidatus Schekmanbacteria bacterium RIFCSPHIGHO2_02_FULL_38_11]
MENRLSQNNKRPVAITIIAVAFILWALMVFLDFSEIIPQMSPKMNGKSVNVILGFRIFGIHAKITDVIQLILIITMIYGLFAMKKVGYFLTFAYMIYAVVSTHSWALMATSTSTKTKLMYEIIGIFLAGAICVALYNYRKRFS